MCPFNSLTRCTIGSEKMTNSVNPDEIVSSADPEGGTGDPEPPWKITSYMVFYRE